MLPSLGLPFPLLSCRWPPGSRGRRGRNSGQPGKFSSGLCGRETPVLQVGCGWHEKLRGWRGKEGGGERKQRLQLPGAPRTVVHAVPGVPVLGAGGCELGCPPRIAVLHTRPLSPVLPGQASGEGWVTPSGECLGTRQRQPSLLPACAAC